RCRSTSLLLASFRPASRALRTSRIIPGRHPGADRDRPTTSTRRRVDRQRHAELRAPGAAIDFDLTAVPQNEPPGDVDTQAGALADRLRREEGIEDALADLRRQACPIVDDSHEDGISVMAGRDRDAALRRVQRVVDQVRPDLVEFAAEPLDAWKIGLHLEAHG